MLGALYFLLRNRSEKTKYIVGAIIGVISLAIIVTRNVDILRDGFNPQAIPLQVCHLGNIIIFLALVTKNKTLVAIGFLFNLPYAYSAMIYAIQLVNYSPITWGYIKAQTYMWGHLIIVIGAIYPIMLNTIKFKFKHLFRAMQVVFVLFIIAMLMNLILNGLGMEANYFYAFDEQNLPFGIFADLAPKLNIMFEGTANLFVAWDYVYTLCILGFGLIVFFPMYPISRLIYKLGRGDKVRDDKKLVI
jgi:uncharacterized membrane protein YwaF